MAKITKKQRISKKSRLKKTKAQPLRIGKSHPTSAQSLILMIIMYLQMLDDYLERKKKSKRARKNRMLKKNGNVRNGKPRKTKNTVKRPPVVAVDA
jgi:hypothetical protein